MKRKSTDMQATVQRKYSGGWEYGDSNAIPRDSEFDLKPVMSRTHSGFDECAFESPKPGNVPWTEKDRP